MIPRFKPYVKIRDITLLFQYQQNLYEEFETNFAQLTGSKYALLLPYGRSALYFFFKSFQLEQQEVIMPAYNCQSVIGPILETNNIPVFIDSKEDDFNLDERLIPDAITPNTKVIIASAMYGSPLPLEFFKTLKQTGEFYVIGDYALGFLTYLTTQKEKGLDAFDLIFFSFGLSKEIAFLSGGAVITNNEEIFLKLKAYRDTYCSPASLSFKTKIFLKYLGAYLLFTPSLYRLLYFLSVRTPLLDKEKGLTVGIKNNLPADFPFLPTKFQIKLALKRLHDISWFIREKAAMIEYYYHRLRGMKGIHLPKQCLTYSHFPILIEEKRRDDALHFFINHDIHSTVMFQTTMNMFDPESQENHFPHAEHYTRSSVLLPLYYGIDNHILDSAIEILQQWCMAHHA